MSKPLGITSPIPLFGDCNLILDLLPDHIAILDERGNILQINRAWEEFSNQNRGLKPKTGVGANYLEVCKKSVQDGFLPAREFIEKFKDVCLRRRTGFTLEYPCHSPKEQRWFLVRVLGVESSSGFFLTVIHENLTTRVQLNDDLLFLRKQLTQARRSEILTEWVSGISHQLKNYLTVIGIQSQLLDRAMSQPKARQREMSVYFQKIQNIVHKVGNLLSTMVEMTYEPTHDFVEEYDIVDTLDDILTILRSKMYFNRFQVVTELNVRPLLIEGNKLQMSHFLLNLLLYCLDISSQQSQIELSENEHTVYLKVVCKSIDKRADLSDANQYLKIARNIIERQHGELRVRKSIAQDSVEMDVEFSKNIQIRKRAG